MMISQPFACENEQPTPLISDSRPAFDVALYSMRTQNSYAHVTDARYVLREPISRISYGKVWTIGSPMQTFASFSFIASPPTIHKRVSIAEFPSIRIRWGGRVALCWVFFTESLSPQYVP